MNAPNFTLNNWIPYKLAMQNGQLQCHWLDTSGTVFNEPFFDETISKLRLKKGDHISINAVSDLSMLKEWAAPLKDVKPAAIIFHISRCGSTLVSQLLAATTGNIVLSEVPFFDDILRLPYNTAGFSEAAINELLVTAIKYYSQKTLALKEKRLFIKADSWHLFFYDQLRQLYPSVPFIFMYRRPDEVFKSHSKIPGMHAVPGLIEPQVFGFTDEELIFKGPGIYLSKVLESYLNKYLEIAAVDDQCLFLNYSEGPMPMIEKIAAFTHTTLNQQDLLNMRERSLYHSKKPGERFSEDVDSHIPPCLDKAMELYNMLEKKIMALR